MKCVGFSVFVLVATVFISSNAEAGKRSSACITFRDAPGSVADGVPADTLGSDGLGAICGGGFPEDYVYFNDRPDFRGRGLWVDFAWYEGLSPFAEGDVPLADGISLIEFSSDGIGSMQAGDPAQPVRLKIYFDVGDREFELNVSSNQASPIMAEVHADGSLRITGSPNTVGIIREYGGKGRGTYITEVGTTSVPFEVTVERR